MNKLLFKDVLASDHLSQKMNNFSFSRATNSDNVHTLMLLWDHQLRVFVDVLLICGRVSGFMRDIPNNQHITYQLQFRKCGKASCSTCRNGQGHGPYWYAYWREGSRLRSGYVGKVHPNQQKLSTSPSEIEATAAELTLKESIATPVLI